MAASSSTRRSKNAKTAPVTVVDPGSVADPVHSDPLDPPPGPDPPPKPVGDYGKPGKGDVRRLSSADGHCRKELRQSLDDAGAGGGVRGRAGRMTCIRKPGTGRE
jgi:hypothetical protein